MVAKVAVGSGSRLPLHATALGHVLLAALPAPALENYLRKGPTVADETPVNKEALRRRLKITQRNGYASIQGLLNPRLVAVAVPVRDRNGQVVAVLNVTSYTTPLTRTAVTDRFLGPLSETRSQIEAALRSSHAIPLIGEERVPR